MVAAGLVGGGLLALNFAPMRGGASLGSARDYAVRIVLPRAHEAPRVDEGAVSAATPVALAEPSVSQTKFTHQWMP